MERKAVRFCIKYREFVLVYERIVEKLKPVTRIKAQNPQPKKGGIDIYA